MISQQNQAISLSCAWTANHTARYSRKESHQTGTSCLGFTKHSLRNGFFLIRLAYKQDVLGYTQSQAKCALPIWHHVINIYFTI